ncbi:MAG: SIR2 family protein [Selenomonadaceae bacterium]|nr:SIR2 family protein [Selenomonadaceae bacterium]
MVDRRITALLGAGATLDIGGLDARLLTAYLIERNELIGKIHSTLTSLDGIRHVSFEDIMNGVEVLVSMKMSGSTSLNAFADVNREFERFSLAQLAEAHLELLNSAGDKIYEYEQKFIRARSRNFFVDAMNYAADKLPWDVVTLNYDTCLNQIFEGRYVDGFGEPEPVMSLESDYDLAGRFQPSLLRDAGERSRIMHLHGCIYFAQAIPEDDPNKHALLESEFDAYKYTSYERAKSHWQISFGVVDRNQAGDILFNDPMLIGTKKPDKLLFAYPYAAYLCELQNALVNNSGLLIAGYSCNDVYLNNLLIRMTEMHGSGRRIVIINRYDTSKVGKAHLVTDNEFRVFAHLMNDAYAEPMNFDRDEWFEHGAGSFVSTDGCVRIYFNGLRDAMINHWDEIIKFLSE